MKKHLKQLIAVVMTALLVMPASALAAEVRIVAGAVGKDLEFLREELDRFSAQTGHSAEIVSMPAGTTDQFAQYNLWLAAGASDIDVYQVDVIWAPQLGSHLVDLKSAMGGEMRDFFPSIVESQTVDGRLVAVQAPAANMGRNDANGARNHASRTRRRQRQDVGLCLSGQRLRRFDMRRAGMD